MSKLTKAQVNALLVCSEAKSVSSNFWYTVGVSINTTNSLTRSGLLSETHLANGPHWSITDLGRSALTNGGGNG